ncbi:MAG: M50 family metallopeptidase, partial [Eubacterium sp.]|nr:M50 family metallopeptidase [Eubacterium sp.]
MLITMYISLFIQIIIHEAGHLIFGLLTGYKFRSFRIFNLMFIKEAERIRLKKLSLAGTAGQCLMAPPDMQNGKMPVILYNLGGVITNIITGLAFFSLYCISASIPLLADAMIISSVLAFIFAISNGIPLKTQTINNDGHNTLELLCNENAKQAFFTQMKIAEKNAENIRLKDMPEEWFTLQNDEAIKS